MDRTKACGPRSAFYRPMWGFPNWMMDKETGRDDVMTSPGINIVETADGFRIEVAAPGLKKDFFRISVEKDILTLSAEVGDGFFRSAEGEKVRMKEFAYGSFTRSFRIPQTVDADRIQASYTDGILTVTLQKRAPEQKVTRNIEIA